MTKMDTSESDSTVNNTTDEEFKPISTGEMQPSGKGIKLKLMKPPKDKTSRIKRSVKRKIESSTSAEKKENNFILGGASIFKKSAIMSHFKNALNHPPIIIVPCYLDKDDH